MNFKFKNIFLEPYRLFFLAGSIYSFLSIGIWFGWFWGLEHQRNFLTWQQTPLQIHSHIMIYGVIGFYVFGFILTAFPRFVNQDLPKARTFSCLWVLLLFSQFFLILGTFVKPFWMNIAGILESGIFLFLGIFLFYLYSREGKWGQNKQPFFILVSILFAFMGSLLFYLYTIFHLPLFFYNLSLEFGTYPFLLLLVVSITYRIVPFFTGKVIADYQPKRGKYTLEIVLLLLSARILALLFLNHLKLQYNFLWFINLCLLFVLLKEWKAWLPKNISQAPMLLVLYLGLSWILIFLGFSVYELIVHLIHPALSPLPVYFTPSLHALYVGAFGTLLLGISTRVVRGHGGHPIVADPWMLIALLLIQTAAILRVFIPILGTYYPGIAGKTYWAGAFWFLAFLIWSIRYIPFLFLAPSSNIQGKFPSPN